MILFDCCYHWKEKLKLDFTISIAMEEQEGKKRVWILILDDSAL